MTQRMLKLGTASRLSRLAYIPRIIGFVLMGIMLTAALLPDFLPESFNTLLFIALLLQCLLWPQPSLSHARVTPFKHSAESINQYIDALFYGV